MNFSLPTCNACLLITPLVILFSLRTVSAETELLNDQTGIISVEVEDVNGQAVAQAPIYIFDGHRIQMVVSNDQGTAVLTLQSGHYTVSSSLTRPSPDFVDRFASHEAPIEVNPGDTTSVILSLIPISHPVTALSYWTLHDIGDSQELTRLNN